MNWLSEGFKQIDRVFSDPDDRSSLSLRQNTAEFEYFIARGELDRNGDLVHGMNHLARLLSYDPIYPQWLDLLETYLDRGKENPERLLSEESRNYYAIEAIRAYIYARSGKLTEALQLLNAIVDAKPNSLYMETWGIDWLSQPGSIESLSTDFSGYILSNALNRFPEFSYLTYSKQQYLDGYVKLAKRFLQICKAQSNESSDRDLAINMMYVGLLRKVGYFSEALAQAKINYKNAPGWHSATALGLVLREMGQTETAEKAFRQALKHDSADLSARLEIADMYFNLGDWDKAKTVYEEIPQNSPQFDWAYPSILFCEWQLNPEQPYPEALIEMMSGDSPNYRANRLAERFYTYTGYLPEPSDALANLLRQVLEKDVSYGSQGQFRVGLSCLESPSNRLAFQLALGEQVDLLIEIETIPQPDPRQAIEPVAFTLWAYQGTQASPALPPPNPNVVAAIADLARKSLEISQLWAAASHTAKKLDRIDIRELLAVNTYPPQVPKGFTALTWLPRLQLATAFVIAHLDTGWVGSTRRDALYSLLLGPRDWTTTAAIIALACLAEEYPAIAFDIETAFKKLANAAPDIGGCCYERALYYNWLRLPHLFEQERQELRQQLQAMQND